MIYPLEGRVVFHYPITLSHVGREHFVPSFMGGHFIPSFTAVSTAALSFQEISENSLVYPTTPLFSAKQRLHSHLQPRNTFHRCTYDPETSICYKARRIGELCSFEVAAAGLTAPLL